MMYKEDAETRMSAQSNTNRRALRALAEDELVLKAKESPP